MEQVTTSIIPTGSRREQGAPDSKISKLDLLHAQRDLIRHVDPLLPWLAKLSFLLVNIFWVIQVDLTNQVTNQHL